MRRLPFSLKPALPGDLPDPDLDVTEFFQHVMKRKKIYKKNEKNLKQNDKHVMTSVEFLVVTSSEES